MTATTHAADRAAAISWARDLMGRDDWVVFDCETNTGLGERAQIVQVGIVAPSGRVLLDALIRPPEPIDDQTAAIHGLTNADVRDAPTWLAFAEAVYYLLHERTVCIFNAAFDLRILRQTCQHWETPTPEPTAQCAMLEYAKFVGDWSDYHGSYRWQRLPPVSGQRAHSAAADCAAVLALIKRLAETPDPGVPHAPD